MAWYSFGIESVLVIEVEVPYKINHTSEGYRVTSPNHPKGFSKHPQSKQMAIKQMVAIKMHTKDEGGTKSKKKVGVKKGK